MDQPTKEITPKDGRGIRSNIILDGTKTKLIYATHNALNVYNMTGENKEDNFDFKIDFKSHKEGFLNLEDKFSRIWMNPSPDKTRVFL